jgi:5'-3' exonuclease
MIRRCESLLRDAKISSIYLVFDGVRVPLKSGTNADREEKRRSNLAEARRLLSLGRRKEADEKYKLCVKGTELMGRVVCAAVQRKWGKHGPVKCIFAPYEADSQLAKLCVDGLAHAVVTEDSDVLVYSAVCRRPFPIIYKLDKKDGSCDVVTMDWLLNDKFLTSSGVNGGRRRRRDKESDSDSDSDDSSVEDHARTMQVGKKKVKVASSSMSGVEEHPSEICYGDDNNMMFAPIRRTLPLPSSSSSGNGRGRSKGAGSELLSYLRAFANRELTTPGAGVRLFVQACVLSGCDYVANNLSKVGPIGAFKLVKENAHRDPTVRFERILRGAKILAEPADKGSDDCDDDVAAGDDFLDSLFPSASEDQRREKYEELLSQSEAVFYYHLVKEVDTDEIVPLVAHKSEDDSNNNLEVGEKFKPCLKRFEAGLPFVGSATEAMKRCHEPAPPIQQSNGGWMTTAKGRGFNNNNKHANNNQRQATTAAAVLPPVQKKTSLDKFLASGRTASAGIKNLSSNKPTGMSLSKPTSNGTNRSTLTKQTHSIQSMPKNNPYKSSTMATDRSAKKEEESNPFVQFAHDDVKPKPNKTPVNIRSKGSDKNVTSPFFSPNGAGMNFDYGVHSASKPQAEKKPSHEGSSDTTKSEEDKVAIEPLELDDNGTEPALLETNKIEASMIVKHNLFDYEVVTESPPRSRYFSKPKGEEGLPRRISSSPPEHFKSNQMPSESVEIIDLVDDSNEENILNERKPDSPVKSVPKKPSAINNTFKCPYPDSSSRQSTKRKASAILAGFERQKEICEPRKRPSTGGHLLGQKKSVVSKSIVTKRPTKPSSLKQFFGDKT